MTQDFDTDVTVKQTSQGAKGRPIPILKAFLKYIKDETEEEKEFTGGI